MEAIFLIVSFFILRWMFFSKHKAETISDQQATISTDRRMLEQYTLRKESRTKNTILIFLIGILIGLLFVLAL